MRLSKPTLIDFHFCNDWFMWYIKFSFISIWTSKCLYVLTYSIIFSCRIIILNSSRLELFELLEKNYTDLPLAEFNSSFNSIKSNWITLNASCNFIGTDWAVQSMEQSHQRNYIALSFNIIDIGHNIGN